MKTIVSALLTLFLTLGASAKPAAAPTAESARKAPNFSIAKLIGAPVERISGLNDLKGKVVFLEFWATWCGPCVAGIPRTNRLIEKLKGTGAVFLFVTDEPEDTVRRFLAKRKVKAWVGIDEAKKTFGPYKVSARPTGFLIGRDGALLASIFPDSLQEKEVRDALAGIFSPRPVELGAQNEPKNQSQAGTKPLFELTISPTPKKSTESMSYGDNSLEANGLPFAFNIAWIWEVNQAQIIIDTEPVKSFDFHLSVPDGNDLNAGRALLKTAVQETFNVKVLEETRETDVYLLSLSTVSDAPRPSNGDPELQSGLINTSPGRLLGKTSMSIFAKEMHPATDRPVVDDTGLKGDYSLDLEWKGGDTSARDAALASVGLRLIPARRKIPWLRVVPAKP